MAYVEGRVCVLGTFMCMVYYDDHMRVEEGLHKDYILWGQCMCIPWWQFTFTCMHILMLVCMHVCLERNVYVCMYVYMYVYMYVCMFGSNAIHWWCVSCAIH